MSDLLKRLSIGAGIGIVVALLIRWGTYEIYFLKSVSVSYTHLTLPTKA